MSNEKLDIAEMTEEERKARGLETEQEREKRIMEAQTETQKNGSKREMKKAKKSAKVATGPKKEAKAKAQKAPKVKKTPKTKAKKDALDRAPRIVLSETELAKPRETIRVLPAVLKMVERFGKQRKIESVNEAAEKMIITAYGRIATLDRYRGES